jgi:hypothetical protein
MSQNNNSSSSSSSSMPSSSSKEEKKSFTSSSSMPSSSSSSLSSSSTFAFSFSFSSSSFVASSSSSSSSSKEEKKNFKDQHYFPLGKDADDTKLQKAIYAYLAVYLARSVRDAAVKVASSISNKLGTSNSTFLNAAQAGIQYHTTFMKLSRENESILKHPKLQEALIKMGYCKMRGKELRTTRLLREIRFTTLVTNGLDPNLIEDPENDSNDEDDVENTHRA